MIDLDRSFFSLPKLSYGITYGVTSAPSQPSTTNSGSRDWIHVVPVRCGSSHTLEVT